MLDIVILISMWDIKKFFDKENLRDGMDALYRAGIKEKIYNLWFMLNKKTNIRLRTGIGLTDSKELDELIGQGTLGGAVVSGLNIDLDVNEQFQSSS